MKILYFCCGEGLGHATRTIAAVNALKKEHEVVCASYGYVRDFLIKSGIETEDVPSEIALVGKSGQFDLSTSILTTIKRSTKSPTGILKYYSAIKKHKPDLVMSDSFILPATIAKRKKIPTWMVIQLNQMNIERFFITNHGPMVRFAGKIVKQVNFSALKGMDKLLIPDLSPPFTVGNSETQIHPKVYEKVEFLGPLVRKHGNEIRTKPRKKNVYSMIGGFGYRQVLLNKIIDVSKELPDYHFNLVAGPNAKISSPKKNVTALGQVLDPLPLINEASIIIGGGGHSTAMESICLGKPLLSAPDAFHCEQEENANGIQRIGAGYRIDYKTSVATLKELIEELSTSNEFKKRLRMLQRLAAKSDGRKEILRLAGELKHNNKK